MIIIQNSYFNETLKLANLGDPEAQNQIGLLYQLGIGFEQSTSEALIWFPKSAEQGHAGSQYIFGCLYLDKTELVD